MSREQEQPLDARIQGALDELQGLIQAKYPSATFRVARGEDPQGFYLKAIVDIDDTDEVVDVFIDRLLEMEIEDGLPVYVIPLRPAERVMQASRQGRAIHPQILGEVLPSPSNR
jgi:hypothetical protein